MSMAMVLYTGFALVNFILFADLIYSRIKLRYEKQALETELKGTGEFINLLEENNREMQKFTGEYNGMIITMRALIEGSRMDELKEYYENKVMGFVKKSGGDNSELKNLMRIRNKELRGLLYAKAAGSKKRVKITVDIANDITDINMDVLDLAVLIGNYVDNAIEAAEQSGEKGVYIGIARTGNGTDIVIRNSCVAVPDIKNMNKKGYSTKGKSRGLGLYRAGMVIEKYDNLLHRSYWDDTREMFVQELHITEN